MVVLEPGLRIAGKYRLESPIGDGGMGVVWAATHEQLARPVALKFLLVDKFCQNAAQRSAAVDRFLREGRTAAQLQSEHVVSVLDVGTEQPDGPLPFLVMERLVGTDLEAVLEQHGALAVNDAVDYVLQACEAMAEAHARHIVHRDLKPANLFLTRRIDGSPLIKVLDFGISKQTIAAADALSLTGTGQIIGSPLYMSPEQFENSKDVDSRADIWSLGVIAFTLLTGAHPWGEVESVLELIRRVTLQRPLPLTHYRPDVPEALGTVLAACLEAERERRLQSVRELAVGLSPFASDAGRWSAKRVQNVQVSLQSSAPNSAATAAALATHAGDLGHAGAPGVSAVDTVLESATAVQRALGTPSALPAVAPPDAGRVRRAPSALRNSSGVLRGLWTRRISGPTAAAARWRKPLLLLAAAGALLTVVVAVLRLALEREAPLATASEQTRWSLSAAPPASAGVTAASGAARGPQDAQPEPPGASAGASAGSVAATAGAFNADAAAPRWRLRQYLDAGTPNSAASGAAPVATRTPASPTAVASAARAAERHRASSPPRVPRKSRGKSSRAAGVAQDPAQPRIPERAFPERLPLRSTKSSR